MDRLLYTHEMHQSTLHPIFESTTAPLLPCPEIPAKPACQLPTEKMLADLAGQHRQHHKPPVVLKSQVFCFWYAGGILTLLLLSHSKLSKPGFNVGDIKSASLEQLQHLFMDVHRWSL